MLRPFTDSSSKRIFLLGPSHHYPLATIALPELTKYATPLSSDPLPLDTAAVEEIRAKASRIGLAIKPMTPVIDQAEHSLEMHLPFIHRVLQRTRPNDSASSYPPLVPIMVGSPSPPVERAYGRLLAPFLADPDTAIIVSSDFCHWGARFGYTHYAPHCPCPGPSLPLSAPQLPQPAADLTPADAAARVDVAADGGSLRFSHRLAAGTPRPHESISAADLACMAAVATGSFDAFLDAIGRTGNTVCGRHPIGVVMAALEEGGLVGQGEAGVKKGRFHFVRYERSSDAITAADSSVSYVSAVAWLE